MWLRHAFQAFSEIDELEDATEAQLLSGNKDLERLRGAHDTYAQHLVSQRKMRHSRPEETWLKCGCRTGATGTPPVNQRVHHLNIDG